MSGVKTDSPNATAGRLEGLLVEFDSPTALVAAAEQIRDAGYRRWDTHTPFPVHGIDEAMGIRPTRLPFIVFLLGFIGCIGGLVLQWWTNATGASDFPGLPTFLQGYNYLISGKPEFSLPANIPVIFETTVLLAAFAAVFGMLAMNNLPKHHTALFASERFRRVTTDRFFVYVDAADAKFDEGQTTSFLGGLGGSQPEAIHDIASSPSALPGGLKVSTLILISLLFIPPLVIARARVAKSNEPRIHIIQDMDNQERFKAQQAASAFFADGRASRPQPEGTVARGDLRFDTHYYEGKIGGEYATTYPEQVTINEQFIRRGQERFNVYCAPCHGLGGAGNGTVNATALRLETAGWIAPTSLHDQLARSRPLGHIYNSISNGIRSMPPYGDQISPTDRWAIVSYIRALQFSQQADLDDVPPEVRPELR